MKFTQRKYVGKYIVLNTIMKLQFPDKRSRVSCTCTAGHLEQFMQYPDQFSWLLQHEISHSSGVQKKNPRD
jgi:hypothetical protein